MDVAHDIDSTPVWTFGDDLDTERTNAMRHKNSVYHGIKQYVPQRTFHKLVEEHAGDKGVRTLTMEDQFGTLLYGQLSGASSLRELGSARRRKPMTCITMPANAAGYRRRMAVCLRE